MRQEFPVARGSEQGRGYHRAGRESQGRGRVEDVADNLVVDRGFANDAAMVALYAAGISNPTSTAHYVFGTNAIARLDTAGQAVGTVNWPTNCYAREVLCYCDQNAWVSLISVNPEYFKDVTRNAFNPNYQISADRLILEVGQYLPAGAFVRLFPTYGYGALFRAAAIQGTITLWVSGNVEGDE